MGAERDLDRGSRRDRGRGGEIRQFFLDKSSMFQTDAHWVSDHPAYKVEITVNGDLGTLHFECHYIDYDKI